MVETRIRENGRNHAISPVVYHFMEKLQFSDTRRTRAAGRQFRRSTGTAYCESYELRNGNCAPAFRKLPDENIQWPARCSIATDNRIKRRKCGPWERYLPPTSYEINGSLGKKRTKNKRRKRNERKRA